MRFKQLDHKWLVRNTPELFEEHATHSKLPIVPTVIQTDHDGSVIRVMQDSTPIMEQLEREFSDRSLSPPSASLRFISELMEEFADEWANKWMMHYRWYAKTSKPDAATYSRRIAVAVSYTHLRAHETPEHLVCRLLLEKKKKKNTKTLNCLVM
eukprot:TRINITY_DN14901_c0_g1_i3.p1 TRINITY_DN14901_c0_g1~~TRINITY_DN14901_c0_g1_i3.p1  ORF type:complete len:154 (+),score=44.56 TRINITY_DN14901_c0_g1_i3:75-536(+)